MSSARESSSLGAHRVARQAVYWRVGWTIASYLVVESIVLGVSAIPGALVIHWMQPRLPDATWLRVIVYAVGLLPTYLTFAFALVVCTAAATNLLGWRARPGQTMALREFGWPLLHWARGNMLTHVVRVLVGGPTRASPLWGLFIRLNGAKVGRRVWVNSTEIMDHALLEFGDDTVIGSSVHLSGHTVEGGAVKTGCVRVGRNVTIGVGSLVGVGSEIGDGCQVGALSVVPKWSRLDGHALYVGAPVRKV